MEAVAEALGKRKVAKAAPAASAAAPAKGAAAPAKAAAMKKPAAAPVEGVCKLQRNLSRNVLVVLCGAGPGSTKSLSYGRPTSTYASLEDATAEAERLMEEANRTGKRPW